MKILLLLVLFLMASCAGKRTMMVTGRNSEGITVSAEWRDYAGYATNSAGSARRWFAREATKLAQAEGGPVSAVRLQSATLSYQDFPGVCIATLRGAAFFGDPSPTGAAFHDGSPLMTQAVSEDRRIQKNLVARGAFSSITAADSPRAFARASQLHPRTRRHMMTMPQYASRPSTSELPEPSRKTDAGRSSRVASRTGQLPGTTSSRSGGVTSTRSGSTVVSSTGAASKKDGDTWYHSKGVTSTRRGNVVYNSDGTSYTISASGTMYLNGKGS